MNEIDVNRKLLNQHQTELRQVMRGFDQHEKALALFMKQHAILHTGGITQSGAWSFEDTILNDMSVEQIRHIPKNSSHSVAWLIWHMTRIEDVAINMLVAGSPQTLHTGNWYSKIKVDPRDTGNLMAPEIIARLSAAVDIDALRAYRLAVGRRTRAIVDQLPPEALKQKVAPDRLQKLLDEGAVVENAVGLIDYWGKRDIAGLLLMPATRHNIVHLNEALRIKKKR